MTLSPSTGAVPSTAAVDVQIQRGIDGDPLLSNAAIGAELAQAYYDYSIEGTLPGADLTAGGDVALLEAAFTMDNTPAGVARLAQGICDYWSTCTTPGAPAHGGTVVQSVTINGAAMYAAMTAAINAFVASPSPPGFEGLYAATEPVVKTIPCVIVELIPPTATPTPFPELIT